jgi:hypothetical protein
MSNLDHISFPEPIRPTPSEQRTEKKGVLPGEGSLSIGEGRIRKVTQKPSSLVAEASSILEAFKENIPPVSDQKIVGRISEHMETAIKIANILDFVSQEEPGKVEWQSKQLLYEIGLFKQQITKEIRNLTEEEKWAKEPLNALFKELESLESTCNALLMHEPAAKEEFFDAEETLSGSEGMESAVEDFSASSEEILDPLQRTKKEFEFKMSLVGDLNAVDPENVTSLFLEQLKEASSASEKYRNELDKLKQRGDQGSVAALKDLDSKERVILTNMVVCYEDRLQQLESMPQDEGALRETASLLKEEEETLYALFQLAEPDAKTQYSDQLESVGAKTIDCQNALEKLFQSQLASADRSLQGTFKGLETLLGKGLQLPATYKMTLLTFLKLPGATSSFVRLLKQTVEQLKNHKNQLSKGILPKDEAGIYLELNSQFIQRFGEIGKNANDLLRLATMIGAKLGLEQNAQAFTDALLFAVKSENEVLSGESASQSTALRYARGLKFNRTVPQSSSPPQERVLLEREQFKKLETGMLGRVDWQQLSVDKAQMKFTLRAAGANAQDVPEKSFTTTLDFSATPWLEREALLRFIESFYSIKTNEAYHKAVKEGNLRILVGTPVASQIVEDPAFWDWVKADQPADKPEMAALKGRALERLSTLVATAQAFYHDSMVKYVRANIDLE